jgi:hypothetical protein
LCFLLADLTEYDDRRWTQCHLSGEALTPPCVIDELGTLYNKDAVVSALLNKTMPEPMSSYITGLKSVVELRLERNVNARKWVSLIMWEWLAAQ